jgi:hypothetical protein
MAQSTDTQEKLISINNLSASQVYNIFIKSNDLYNEFQDIYDKLMVGSVYTTESHGLAVKATLIIMIYNNSI